MVGIFCIKCPQLVSALRLSGEKSFQGVIGKKGDDVSDSKESKWNFDLAQYFLSSSGNASYRASISEKKTLKMTDIAALIEAEKKGLRKETIAMVASLLDANIIKVLCEGCAVVTGSAVFQPMITGVFKNIIGKIDPKINEYKISTAMGEELRKSLDAVEPVFTGRVREAAGASISLVTDLNTGSKDGLLSPGGALIITGNKIKCVNADGSGHGIIRLINTETNEVTQLTGIVENLPKSIICVAPRTLKKGTYTMQIETYYTRGSTLLKTARTLEYSLPLTVK